MRFRFFLLMMLIPMVNHELSFGTTIKLGLNALPSPTVHIFSRSTNHSQVLRQLYEPPFLIDEHYTLMSPYFSSWNISVNGKIYVFKLKD